MLPELLHISRAEVEGLALSPAEIRAALREAFEDLAAGKLRFQPKAQMSLGEGHIFQTLMAVSERRGIAALKWVGMGPGAAPAGLPAVSALICLNDLATGHPVAVLDGEEITLLRTAGLSALAAETLAPKTPQILGFAGCGAQAHSHLIALRDLYPNLQEVHCYSRTPASAEKLALTARALGLTAKVVVEPRALCEAADLLVSTIPASAGLQPVLDARWMKSEALALMVDLGRSWRSESFAVFDRISTDSLVQMPHPYGPEGQPVTAVRIEADLETGLGARGGRQAFCFRGHAAGDLAVALLVHDRVRAKAGGQRLSR